MTTQALSKSQKIKWLFCILLPAALFFIPTNDTFTSPMRNFLIITLFGIMLFGFELVDTMIGSFILMFGYIIFNVAPMTDILAPWTQDIPWMLMGSLILVEIVQHTPLLKRIAFFCAIKTGGSYTGIIFALITIGIVVSVLIPSSTAVVGLFIIAYGLCKALNLGVSLASAGIMIATAMGFMDAYYFVYSPTYIALLYNAVNQVTPVTPDYVTFFLHNAIFVVGLYIKAFIIAKIAKPKEGLSSKEYFIEQRSALGKLTTDEKKIIVVLLALIVYLFTYQWHGLSMMYGFVVAPIILFLPGINLGTTEDVRNANYSTVVFIAACMSIGNAATAVGIGDAFSSVVYPLLEGASPTVFLLIIWIIIVIFNFLMTPAAEMAVFGVPFAQICVDMGINVLPMMYTFFQGGSNLLLPYEAAMWLVCYGFGAMKMKHFAQLMGVKMIFDLIFLVVAGIPYWNIIGLL